jgi:ParB family transcriptional regulator, chromosome partitioning protein
MPLQLDDLAALDAPGPTSTGQPLLLPVADIDEDPDQPRREFDANGLQELSETIRERGVRQPISVRPNLQMAGRWTLNFGARRLRATKLAGLQTIPAFVDTTADSYDQVIENEQREGLKPLELALFVQKRLALGDRQADIAKNLGKSRQWVTLATALIEAPDWLLQAYREGRCRGIMELYELRRLHGEHPQYIEACVSERASITRDNVAAMKAALTGDAHEAGSPAGGDAMPVVDAAHGRGEPTEAAAQPPGRTRPLQKTNKRLHVEMDGQDYQLVVSVAPAKEGHLYVRPLTGGPRRLAPAGALKLRGFVSR